MRKSALDAAIQDLETATNHTQAYAYVMTWPDRYELVRDGGQWIVSPGFMSKMQLTRWIRAYIAGIRDGQKILANSRRGE